ncbi:MAG: hypothetical protein WD845_17570, partial [Pirellulales bacterium]
PKGPPFTLNSAVDQLLKQEFDVHRAKDQQHPLQAEYGIDAKPCPHEKLDVWRQNFKGVEALHGPTKLLITGAIDDIWIDGKGDHRQHEHHQEGAQDQDAPAPARGPIFSNAYHDASPTAKSSNCEISGGVMVADRPLADP